MFHSESLEIGPYYEYILIGSVSDRVIYYLSILCGT